MFRMMVMLIMSLIDQNQIFNNYLIQGNNINIPELVFSFEISKIDLNKLLKEHFQCSHYLSLIIYICDCISRFYGTSHIHPTLNETSHIFIISSGGRKIRTFGPQKAGFLAGNWFKPLTHTSKICASSGTRTHDPVISRLSEIRTRLGLSDSPE